MAARSSWWTQVQKGRAEGERQLRRNARVETEVLRDLARDAREGERTKRQAARDEARAVEVGQQEAGEARADAFTKELDADVAELRGLLAAHLARRAPVALDDLVRIPPRPGPPVELSFTEPPRWKDFDPGTARGWRRARARAEREYAEESFRLATQRWRVSDEERRQQHAREIADHELALARVESQIEKAEGDRRRLRAGVDSGDPNAVAELVSRALEAVHLPERLRQGQQVVYRREHRQIVVQLELPRADVVPADRAVAYVKKTGQLKRFPRRVDETAELYALVVAQVVIVCLDQCFLVDVNVPIDEVVLNAHVEAVDPSSGHDVHPCLVSVETERATLSALNLNRVDPISCLRNQLSAEVSRRPTELEAVEPFLEFDKAKWRISDPADPLTDLDSTLDLLAIHHRRFEKIVTDLLRAMDLISYNTPQSNDGGVDTVSFHRHIVSGGEFAVQTKQYTKAVPVKDIRELAGVVDVRRATRGFLVTTAWASPMAKAFARENNRVRIIEGGELKHLLKEHLGLEAKIDIESASRRA